MNSYYSYQETSNQAYGDQISKYETKQKALQDENSSLPRARIRGKPIKLLKDNLGDVDVKNDPKKGKLTFLSTIKKFGNDLQIKKIGKKIDSLKVLRETAQKASNVKHTEIELDTDQSIGSAIKTLHEEIRTALPADKKALQAELKGLQLALKHSHIDDKKNQINTKKETLVSHESSLKTYKDNKKKYAIQYKKNPNQKNQKLIEDNNSSIKNAECNIKITKNEIKDLQSEIKDLKKFLESPTTKAFNNVFGVKYTNHDIL